MNVAFKTTLFLVGLAAIAFGLSQIYRPLGFVAVGAILVWVSFLISAEQNARHR